MASPSPASQPASSSARQPQPQPQSQSQPPSRPLHLRASSVGLVLLGGALGTAARESVSLLISAPSGVPLGILAANLIGAFLLGTLLEALARRDPHHTPLTHLRLLLGTGFLGGFTTYSTLALDSARMLGDHAVGTGLVYALGSVLAGGIAALAGIAIAAAARPATGEHAR